MCGIAGFVGQGNQSDLDSMVDALVHRGPDDRGSFFDQGVGLGHTRLSILDLSEAGHQPMYSADKKTVIIFNGEIYNFKLLRLELENKGVFFKGSSDTEVILELYQQFGESCFEKMNGMFAIAIYDFEKKVLILARDRMGKKPLYWSYVDDTILFASELKALIKHPLFKKELDLESLQLYLANDYVPTPRTMFKGVSKLEPASYIRYDGKQITKKTFWSLRFSEKKVELNEAIHGLDAHINRSVASRLVADVPVGIFLSGGLDSSTIAYYAQKNSLNPVDTFSVGFEESSFDESSSARLVADVLGTKHHYIMLSAQDSLEILPQITEMLDEPIADASILPTYLLSRFTKKQVTVALGGDGGDELFAGYPTFQAYPYALAYARLPWSISSLIKKTVNHLGGSEENFSLSFKLKKFVEGVDANSFVMHQRWLGTFNSEVQKELLTESVLRNGLQFDFQTWVNPIADSIKASDEKNRILGMYMRTYLMDEVMVKVDRASMFASLETRSPFLDYELVDYANSLPYSFKMHHGNGKFILKKLMEDKLPHSIVYRSKKGFGVPMAKWAKNELRPLFNEMLSKSSLEKQGLFNYSFVVALLDDHITGRRDNRKQLWNLVMFQLWYARWF